MYHRRMGVEQVNVRTLVVAMLDESDCAEDKSTQQSLSLPFLFPAVKLKQKCFPLAIRSRTGKVLNCAYVNFITSFAQSCFTHLSLV